MASRLRDHPLRQVLAAEVHARPFIHLEAPERATHLALLTGEGAAEADRAQVAALCRRLGGPEPKPESTFHLADLGPFRLRWERHSEFSTFGFFLREAPPGLADGSPDRFAQPVIERVPADWLAGLEGELLVALNLELERSDAPPITPEALPALLGVENFAGSAPAGGAASLYMNFAIGRDGFGRILLRDEGLRPRQAGRLVQRLFEIETYRMMALLAFPLARAQMRSVSAAEARLTEIIGEVSACRGLEDERALLDRLIALATEVERMAAASSYRLGAARAYHALVERRIEELREERIEGFQTVGEFMDRRLSPAMRTCRAAAERLAALSERVARAGQLLRTRVDIELEAANRDLLRSMNRRARLQLLLQQTVEGLSVAAITYYGVGLVGYAAKAAKAAGLPIEEALVTGLAIPLVAVLVWYGVRRVRRVLERQGAGAEET